MIWTRAADLNYAYTCMSQIGRAVTRLSVEREAGGLIRGLVKLDAVLPMASYCCDISSKGAVLPGLNDAEMGPSNSLHA